MFLILFSLIRCLVGFWIYLKISSKVNVLVPKLPKALNLVEFGLFKFSFNDLCKRIIYIGEYTNENGGVTRFNYGPIPAYVVSDAQDMITVLNKCTKKVFIYDLSKPYLSQLIAADFPVWKRNRRLLDLAFKQNILNGYMDIFNAQANRLITAMAKDVNKETDFSSLIGRILMETTCLTALGIQMNGQKYIVDRYIKSVDKVMEVITKRFQKPWLILDFIFKWSSLKKEQDEALKIVWDFSEEIIKKKKNELSQLTNKNGNDLDEDNKFHSILEIVLENRDEKELSDFHLRQLIDNIILGAFDTNISGLLFSLLCIGSYPEVQRKVYEEVISVTGKADRNIEKDDLPKLVYLEAAIKEALRIYPPGLVLGRTATSDVQLIVSDAQDMITVLNKCTKKVFIYDLSKPYLSQLIAADFPVWKRNRRLLDLAFKQNILNGYMDIFNAQANRLITAMAKDVNKETDFSSLIGRILMETTCLTALGIQMNGQKYIVDRYIKSVDKVMEVITKRFQKPWLILDFIFKWSSLKKEQDEALKIVWDFSEEIIKKKKNELSQLTNKNGNDLDEDNKFHSILEIVLENRDEKELSDFHLRQLIDNIILGAFDTNISGLLFSLLCIGSYPEVQRKVYEEVISVTGKADRNIEKDDLPKLVYLEAAIKEALRIYPPGLVLGRTATSDVQLKDYILPDGCHIVLHMAAVNRNKNYWGQDADQYRPERWFDALPDECAAFASFSPGRRGCIGKNYALMMLKIIVAKLIKKCHIGANDKNLDLEFVVFVKATAGHLIKLELRE